MADYITPAIPADSTLAEMLRGGDPPSFSGEIREAFVVAFNTDQTEGRGIDKYKRVFDTEEKAQAFLKGTYFCTVYKIPVLFLRKERAMLDRFAIPLYDAQIIDTAPSLSLRQQALAKLTDDEKRALGLKF